MVAVKIHEKKVAVKIRLLQMGEMLPIKKFGKQV